MKVNPSRARGMTGLILLFDGEAVPHTRNATSTTKPVSWLGAWPRSRLPRAHGASGLWEFVARYSGATVPESHGVPRHLAAT